MFGGMVPTTIEWMIQEAGLFLYSAGLSPVKGGPLLSLGANYPFHRRGEDPLTDEESNKLRKQLKEKLGQKGYKSKIRPFVHDEDVDYNDFRFKIILKAKDVDPVRYAEICRLHIRMREANRP